MLEKLSKITKELIMKKSLNTKSNLNIRKRAAIFSGFLVLLLVISSSIAMADSGLSENSKALELNLAPINPDFVKYEQEKISSEPRLSNGHETGHIPSPVDVSHLSAVSVKTSFPSKYDLRTLNKVTSVKDQGNTGSCWAFATYGALESYLLSGKSWDFSENNLKNVLSNVAPEGFDYIEGGNSLMSTAYLARGSGPVDEKDDPYSDTSTYSSNELGLLIHKHVRETIWVPSRQGSLDNDGIKSAIQKYGAIDTSIYYDDNCYSPTTHSYYYSGSSYTNHDVTIVGWDDSYSRNNFSVVPPGDGAFIVKNSWGSAWGENGYFYISYYDSKIGSENTIFVAEDTNNYSSIYQYDPFGCVISDGFGTPTAWCANIFTAKSDEILKAVSFYTVDSNCKYEIYVNTANASSSTINKAGAVISKSGTSSYAGYHTIPLDSGVQLKAGQKFAVILKFTTTGDGSPIAMEYPYPGYSSKATANAGESFVSSDGQNWYDLTDIYANTNACIKAFATTGSASPVANFSANPTAGNAPLKVQFTDKSTGTPTSWSWSFGDGNTSTSQSPAYTYSKAGSYTVSLTVKNAAGTNTKTINNYITVKTPVQKPVAAFSASPTSGNAPLKVQFTDKSTGTPTSWNWSFGDGKTSTAKNPAYTYSKAGSYTVSLTVKNAAGTNTKTINNYVTVKTPVQKPVAAFSASPTSGNAPLKVQFTDKSTGTPTSWSWSFGDGKTSTSQNPAYTYSKAGSYTVSLTVKNAAGTNTKTINNYVTVKTPVQKPVAAFSASPTSGKAPLKVQFTDKSTGTPTSWNWSFGDGKTSTAKNPAYTYSKVGTYTVSLTVKNAAGSNTKTTSGYVKVSKK
jgi:PKD repeat protein